MTVVIGIDPHKASHTATAIGPGSVEAATIRLRAARSTPEELLSWAAQWPERRWGVEGARGLGQLLAQQLVAAGEHVVDATLSARVRTLDTGHGRKTDHIDARAVALVAAQRPDLPRVTADDHRRVLRLLADRRDELTSERRRTINRLHRHLRDLIAGGAPTQLNAKEAAGLPLRSVPATASSPSANRWPETSSSTCGASTAPSRRTADAAPPRWPPAAPAFATWRGSATCSPPRSSATSATSAASPAPTASPATQAPRPSKPGGDAVRHRLSRHQPPTQPRHPPRRPHPDHPPRPRPRLLPAPTRHRQQPQRSPPTPQTTTHQNHLPHPPHRRQPHPPKRRDLT